MPLSPIYHLYSLIYVYDPFQMLPTTLQDASFARSAQRAPTSAGLAHKHQTPFVPPVLPLHKRNLNIISHPVTSRKQSVTPMT